MRGLIYAAAAAVFICILVKKRGLHLPLKKQGEQHLPDLSAEGKACERCTVYAFDISRYEDSDLAELMESRIELELIKFAEMGFRSRVEFKTAGNMIIVLIICDGEREYHGRICRNN